MKKKNKFGMYKNLALITQIGLNAVIPVVFGVWLGDYIDGKIGKKGVFSIVLLILGTMVGFFNIFKLALPKKSKSDDEDDKEEDRDGEN